MSVWAKANEAEDSEQAYAAMGVQDMQRGREDAARFFFELAAKYRAIRYEFRATGTELEKLYAERLVELRRRVEVLNHPRI